MTHVEKLIRTGTTLCVSSLLACVVTAAHAAKPATPAETPATMMKEGALNRENRGLPQGVYLQHTKQGAVLHNGSKQEITVQGMVAVPPGKKIDLVGGQYKVTLVQQNYRQHLRVNNPEQRPAANQGNNQQPNNQQNNNRQHHNYSQNNATQSAH
jgi:hypothetical protein